MAVSPLGIVASAQSKVSGTTLVVTFNQAVPIGTHLTLVLGYDNHASATSAVTTLPATIGGVAPTLRLNPAGSGQTTTAGSGVWLKWWQWVTTAAIASGATFTITFDTAVVAKSAIVLGLSGMTNTPCTGASTSANGSTAGTPSSPTGGTAPTQPAVTFGVVVTENPTVTGDSDTLNGSWSQMYSLGTSGGNANTNICVGVQYKELTANGAQTFNPVGAGDTVASTLSVVASSMPAAAPFIGFGIPL